MLEFHKRSSNTDAVEDKSLQSTQVLHVPPAYTLGLCIAFYFSHFLSGLVGGYRSVLFSLK